MKENQSKLTVAVITGGHPYDVPNLHRLFRSFHSLDCYIQHMADFIASPKSVRDVYDVVVFYNFNLVPVPEGDEKAAIEHLGNSQQGIVVWHHALWSYPNWPLWADLCGITGGGLGAQAGQTLHMEVTNVSHPITADLQSWDIIDETYKMADAAKDSEILVTTEYPECMKTIAWTRQYKKSRVFCFELGHDNESWTNESFRTILEQGIVWSRGN